MCSLWLDSDSKNAHVREAFESLWREYLCRCSSQGPRCAYQAGKKIKAHTHRFADIVRWEQQLLCLACSIKEQEPVWSTRVRHV